MNKTINISEHTHEALRTAAALKSEKIGSLADRLLAAALSRYFGLQEKPKKGRK